MKTLLTLFLLSCSIAYSQGFPSGGALASSTPVVTGNVKFSPVSGTVTGAKTICLYSGTACGNNVPGTDIFYTLDGTAATEASTWYPCPASSTGCVSMPDPSSTRTVTINAVLVQTENTTTSPCSVGRPCYGVIVQDGQAVKSRLKTVEIGRAHV